jgi:selenocysteine lyase/cysteine desulfurase
VTQVAAAAQSAPLARSHFALDPAITYLNHAAVGVLPITTRDALHAFIDGHAQRGVLGVYRTENAMPAFRATIADFIGATAGEIATLRSTGEGATILAQGLDLGAGDEIVTNRNEFGSNAYPWLALRKRGVVVRLIDAPRQRMTPDVLAAALTPRTKVVAVSWVTFDDGYRHDLASLAEVAHRAGALFFVDAIQGLGAFPFDVNALDIDACYAGGAKWLMALQGVSFLYVRARVMERIAVNLPGWRSVDDIWNFLAYDQPWAADATRYEAGTPNFIGALSLATSMALLAQAGTDRIGDHVLTLTDQLVEGLERHGAIITSERSGAARSGIVRFTLPGHDPIALGEQLAAAGFVTTNRASGIRVSPHGYNTSDEIDAFLREVAAIRLSASR